MAVDEPLIRLLAFAGVFLALAGLEFVRPRRVQAVARWARWPGNLGLLAISALVLRVLFPLGAVIGALWAQERGVGLLNLAAAPAWLEILLALVLLDLAVWAQHVAFHRLPWLWRLHRVHHADQELDVTSGLRFHPVEIVLSMGVKIAVVVALGADPLAVVLFEVLLNAAAMFAHANIALPAWLDRGLRAVLVTPDMHRIHHSTIRQETDSNFGTILSAWDRIFRLYRREPRLGQLGMTIGLDEFREAGDLRLGRLLTLPFGGPAPAPRAGSSR